MCLGRSRGGRRAPAVAERPIESQFGAATPRDRAKPPTPARSGRALIPLNERELQRLWEAGQFPAAALVTEEGVPLQIVYRGRPNSGPGPDFRDAVVALPDARLLHGDIELHLAASDFRRHGHGRDPAYSRIILHLVYRADTGPRTALPGGREAPVVALERWLSSRAAEIQAMLEQPALWREPCQSAVERMGEAAVQTTVARLAERRLRTKAAAIRRQDPASALYESMLRSLGYGPQRGLWVELGRRLPVSRIDGLAGLGPEQAARSIEALFLAASGLLPAAKTGLIGDEQAYVVDAWQRWRLHGAPAYAELPRAGSTTVLPSRPVNHPARRMAGLARLFSSGSGSLLARVRSALLTERAPAQALLQLLTVEAGAPWDERLLPWSDRGGSQPALIGRAKANELALNAVLPVLLAEAGRDRRPLLAEAVWRAYHQLPLPSHYGKTAHLSRALRVNTGSLIRSAAHAQGALDLYANYCTQGGCGRCPLS